MTIDLSIIVAVLALVLSIYSTVQTVRFNRKQVDLMSNQKRLNDVLLEQEEEKISIAKCADVRANFVPVGSKGLRLRIFNQGQSEARNVRIDYSDLGAIVSTSDLEAKFPMERLLVHQSVDVAASHHLEDKSKFVIQLLWDDDSNQNRSSTLHLTL